MKKHLIAALAVSLLAAPVFAADAPAAKAPEGHPMMEKLDTNHDGKISRDEFRAQGDKMFEEADTNKDGFISPDEMKAAHEARRAKWEAHKKEMKDNKAPVAAH